MSCLPKNLIPVAFLAALAAVGRPAVGSAQCPPPTNTLTEGEVGLYFDPLGTETCADIGVGVATPLYIVARVPEGGVAAFAIPELLAVALPPGLVILGSASLPPGGPYDPLIVTDGCSEGRRSDPTTCPVVQGDLLVMSVTKVMALTPVDAVVCFQTACPTIAGVVAMPPVYFRCDAGASRTLAGGDAMCIGFGQAQVSVETNTWGAVKILYGD